MPTYRLSPLAETDLGGIWTYTQETWSTNQADKHFRQIIDAVEKLASGDKRGSDVDSRDGYLKYSVGKHFVIYKISDTEAKSSLDSTKAPLQKWRDYRGKNANGQPNLLADLHVSELRCPVFQSG